MKYLLVLLSIVTLVDGAFNVHVCFTVEDIPVSMARVKCWDRDTFSAHDPVGPSHGGLTDENGCVSLYDNRRWSDWFWRDHPDIYCQILPNGDCFAGMSTSPIKWDHNPSRNLILGTFNLEYDADYCGDFDANSNGCGPTEIPSWLTDALTSVSEFAAQCAAHDNCFRDCDRPRSECDSEFRDDMYAVCGTSLPCEILAEMYYAATDTLGESFCELSRPECSAEGRALCSQ